MALEVQADNDGAWHEGFCTGLPTLFGSAAWSLVVGVAMFK